MVKRIDINSTTVLSQSSKLKLFLFIQKHRIRQDETIFHSTALWRLPRIPLQQVKRPITHFGMTQANPMRLKKVFHKAIAISQWNKRWSTKSPLLLHIQHQLKNITLMGTIFHQILFQRNEYSPGEQGQCRMT